MTATPNQVRDGHGYHFPVEGCRCDISLDRDPDMEPTREFVDYRGFRMEGAG